MDGFRYTMEMSVRYADLDPMNHVNNAVYSTFLEEARGTYFEDVIGVRFEEEGVVIADVEMQFERPISRAESPVEVGVRVPELGGSSFPIEYEIHAGGERKTTGSTTLVCYDRAEGTSRPIPESWREAIVEYEGLDG